MSNQVQNPVSDQRWGVEQDARSMLKPVLFNGHCPDTTSQLTEDLVAELAGLRRRLDTLPVIEQSKGILMGYFGIDADTAFNVLRRWSSHTNIKLRDLSRRLVDAASTPARPGQPPRAALDHLITCLQARDSPLRTTGPGFRP